MDPFDNGPGGPECFGGSDFPTWEEEVEALYDQSVESVQKTFKERLYKENPSNVDFFPPLREKLEYVGWSKLLKNPEPADEEKETIKHGWIQLYSGRKFYPLDPKVEDIDIEDIAHSLSHQCRFTGHVKSFYSVAQHSVLVSYLCGANNALWGLLHDGSEAYLVDVPKPLKKLPVFTAYRELEHKVQEVICKKFGLPLKEPPAVKQADIKMLATEARDLMSPLHPEWRQPTEPYPFKIEPLQPAQAKDLFLRRYRELTENNDVNK